MKGRFEGKRLKGAVIAAVLCVVMLASQTVCFAAYNTVPGKNFPKVTEVEIATGISPDMEMHIKFSNNVSDIDEEKERDAEGVPSDYMIGVNERNLTKFHMYENDGDVEVSDDNWEVKPHPEAKKQTDTSKYFYVYGHGLDTEKDYYIIVDEDLYGNMGNSMGTSYRIDFNIGKEECSFHAEGDIPDDGPVQLPLTLDSSSVENGQKDVPVDSVFKFRFSYNVAGDEVLSYNAEQISLVKVSDNTAIEKTIVKGEEMQDLVMTPANKLEPGTEYKILFSKNMLARNGVSLASPLVLYFTTAVKDDSGDNGGSGGGGTSGGSGGGGGPSAGDQNNSGTGDQNGANNGENNGQAGTPENDVDYFPDIKDSWARSDINMLADMGIVTGSSDGNFGPSRQITRAEIVVMLVRLFDLDSDNMTVYSDTKDHWAKGYISIASSLGYVKGISADKFAPDNMLTRQEMAAILTRIADLKVVEQKADAAADGDVSAENGDQAAEGQDVTAAENSGAFADAGDIASWAAESVEAVRSNGIVSGYPDGTFRPRANITRAEACHMIVNLVKLQEKANENK